MYVVLCLIVFGCQYRCNWLPWKTPLRMTYYVSSGSLNPTHSLTHTLCMPVCHISQSVYCNFTTLCSSTMSCSMHKVALRLSWLLPSCVTIFMRLNHLFTHPGHPCWVAAWDKRYVIYRLWIHDKPTLYHIPLKFIQQNVCHSVPGGYWKPHQTWRLV